MKLQNELPELKRRIEARKEHIIKSAESFKNNKEKLGYRNFKIAFSWAAFRGLYTREEQMDLYKKYDCKDDHIETFLIKGFEETIPGILD